MSWLDDKLIEDWRFKITRLWSMRLALFWAAISAIAVCIPGSAASSRRPRAMLMFALVNIVLCMVLVVARMTKQPGVDVE